MMEIVYGPVILACLWKSLAFGALMALLLPTLLRRGEGGPVGLGERLGVGLAASGFFGLAHLGLVCAADGFPPRIIQSTAGLLATVAVLGLVLVQRGRLTPAR